MPPAPFWQKCVVQNLPLFWLIRDLIHLISWFFAGCHGSYDMCCMNLTCWGWSKPYFPSRCTNYQTKVCFPLFLPPHFYFDSSIILNPYCSLSCICTEILCHADDMFTVRSQIKVKSDMAQFQNLTHDQSWSCCRQSGVLLYGLVMFVSTHVKELTQRWNYDWSHQDYLMLPYLDHLLHLWPPPICTIDIELLQSSSSLRHWNQHLSMCCIQIKQSWISVDNSVVLYLKCSV